MAEKMKGLKNDFEQNGKLTSKEFKALQDLSKNPEQLDKVKPEILKDLKKDLNAEKKSYEERSKNDISKARVGWMIDKVIGKIDSILKEKQTEQPKTGQTETVNNTKEKKSENKQETIKEYFEDKKEIKIWEKTFFIDKNTENELKKEWIMDKNDKNWKIANEESLKLYINENPDKFKTPEEVVAYLEEKTWMIILTNDIDDYISVVHNIENWKDVWLRSPEMPDSDFEKWIFERKTFDENLLKEINNKISYLTVETDSWKQNIADLLVWKSISFENGKISEWTSKLEKKAENKLTHAIDEVFTKYDLDPKKVQINFTVDKWWLFSSDNLKAIDASWKKTDNAYDLLSVTDTVKVKNWIIKSLDKIEDNKNYKLQVDKKDEILNWKALKKFIDANKFTPKEKDKEKLDIDKGKLTFEEISSLDKNTLDKKWITFEDRTEQEDWSIKYEFDRKDLWTWSLFVELTKSWKYTISSPRLLKNKNISSKNLQADLIKMDDLTWLKLNLEYDINNLEKKLNKQEKGDLSVNVNDENKARMPDMKKALKDLKTFNTMDDYAKIKFEMLDALDGKGKNVQEVETDKDEKFKKEVSELQKENAKEKLDKENLDEINDFIETDLKEHKFTVNELFWKDFKDIAITSPEFKWLKDFDKDDIANWIWLNWLEAHKGEDWNYLLKFEFNDSWANEDFNKHKMKLETDKNWKVILDKDAIISDIKKAAKESVKSMKKEEKEK